MSRAVAGAARVYAIALRLLPRQLRNRYGDDMRRTFEDRAAACATPAVVLLLARELVDLIATRARITRGALSSWLSSPQRRRAPVGSLSHDIRYAVRMLRRQPGFSAVAVLTLALGIGANTAVFTVVNGVLLRPLPYGDPDRLVTLLYGRPGRVSPWFSPVNYLDITRQSGAFSNAAAFAPITVNLTGLGDPQRVDAAEVNWPFFDVLGVAPRIGRAFTERDATDAAAVIVVSDGFWRRQFAARPDAVGSSLVLDGRPFTVIGVAPPDVALPRRAQFWRPLVFNERSLTPQSRGAQWVNVIARLKPGLDLRQANSAMAIVAARLATEFPNTNEGTVMSATLLHERMVGVIRPTLLFLLGAVTLVLLIACVNVASLLLARAHGRSREVAVRAALGAGRRRLVQQFLAESLVLGVAGGAAGLFVAFWTTRGLVALGPASIPRLAEVVIDWRVLGFTIAVALVTSVMFGLAPAIATTGGVMARTVMGVGRGSLGASGTGTRRTLVVSEMALAVVLLVGAGLLLRSYGRIIDVEPGFSPDRVLTFRLALPDKKYSTDAAVQQFAASFVDRFAHESGVEAAAVVMGLPLDSGGSISTSFRRTGEQDSADAPSAGMRIISPDYFKVMKIPLRSGRAFDAHDDARAPEVVIVNEQAARRYWPDRDPIGQQIRVGVNLTRNTTSTWKTIVGIVGDVKYGSLDTPAPAEIYLPHAQHPVGDVTIAVRAVGDPMALVPTARADLASMDRELPLADVFSMNDVIGRSIAERRFTMLLLAAFAAVAVMLAAIGVYGILAYLVTQRRTEIGVRLAMGATPADVARLFLREGLMLATIGLLCGLGGALAARRALTTLLFGVTVTDPITLGAVAAALGLAALAASYLPARRAAAVDPMSALRTD